MKLPKSSKLGAEKLTPEEQKRRFEELSANSNATSPRTTSMRR